MLIPAARGKGHSIGGHWKRGNAIFVGMQIAQMGRFEGVPVVDIIVVWPTEQIPTTQRKSAGCKSTALCSTILGNLLVGTDVEETWGFVLTSRGEGVSTRMELRRIQEVLGYWGRRDFVLYSRRHCSRPPHVRRRFASASALARPTICKSYPRIPWHTSIYQGTGKWRRHLRHAHRIPTSFCRFPSPIGNWRRRRLE